MAWPPRFNKLFKDWPQDAVDLPVQEMQRMYERGFIGARDSPEAWEEFRSSMSWPDGDDVAHEFDLAGSGAGKLVIPFVWVLDMFPGCWPGAQGQARGDCSRGSALVRMADGTLKRIMDVGVGEYVVSAANRVRRVVRTICKPYKGEMVRLRARGFNRPLDLTPDHRIVVCSGDEKKWKPISEVEPGEFVLIPRAVDDANTREAVFDLVSCCNDEAVTSDTVYEERHQREDGTLYRKRLSPVPEGFVRFKKSRNIAKRFVPLNEKLAWLLGLYLAEGSMDTNDDGEPKRITLNLGSHRFAHAEQAREYFRDLFGTEVVVHSVPSKPSVIYVRCGNRAVASLFGKLCPGNVYSKALPPEIMRSARTVRLACLRGWFDGDGHVNASGYGIGSSSSFNLAEGMAALANSCGLRATMRKVHKRGHTREHMVLSLTANSVWSLYEGKELPVTAGRKAPVGHRTASSTQKHCNRTCTDGLVAEVISTERFECPDDHVYCLVVEVDHSFICDGYAVHNCVSWGSRNATLLTMCCDILSGMPDEETGQVEGRPDVPDEGVKDGVLSTEAYYWWRGYDGEGWYCPGVAKVATQTSGAVVRKNYPDIGIDLTRYSGKTAGIYGARKPPDNVRLVGAAHKIHQATNAKSFESRRDLLYNGYGVIDCGSEGYSSSRDQYGTSKRSGSWAHCIRPDCLIAGPIFKPANEILEGDLVYGHDGEEHEVLKVHRRRCNGEMIRLKAVGLPSVEFTTEHPLLVYRKVGRALSSAGKVQGCQETSIREYGDRFADFKPLWVRARNVRLGDYVAAPVVTSKELPRFPGWVRNESSKTVNRLVDLVPSEDMAWLLGLYIADGDAVKSHKIRLTLGRKKDWRRAAKILEQTGANVRVYEKDTFVRVVGYSAVLADSFRTWFGTSSPTKKIPPWLLTWSVEAVVAGIAHGDGNSIANGRGRRIGTTSLVLAHQIRLALIGMGYRPTIYKTPMSKTGYEKHSQGYAVEWRFGGRSQLKRVGNLVLHRVTASLLVPYHDDVYNFDVEGSNSYVADGVAVHNSMSEIAVDDRDVIKQMFSGPLVLILNSWARWNNGPRDIHQSAALVPEHKKQEWIDKGIVSKTTGNIMIPEGSFWCRWSECKGREAIAYSGANGWPAKPLPYLI